MLGSGFGSSGRNTESHPRRIQLRRAKGWHLPVGAVKVARPTRWGNPYKVQPHGPYTRAEAISLYERDLLAVKLAVTVEDVRRDLAGKDLACFCPLELPCHAAILLRIANERARGGERHGDGAQAGKTS